MPIISVVDQDTLDVANLENNTTRRHSNQSNFRSWNYGTGRSRFNSALNNAKLQSPEGCAESYTYEDMSVMTIETAFHDIPSTIMSTGDSTMSKPSFDDVQSLSSDVGEQNFELEEHGDDGKSMIECDTGNRIIRNSSRQERQRQRHSPQHEQKSSCAPSSTLSQCSGEENSQSELETTDITFDFSNSDTTHKSESTSLFSRKFSTQTYSDRGTIRSSLVGGTKQRNYGIRSGSMSIKSSSNTSVCSQNSSASSKGTRLPYPRTNIRRREWKNDSSVTRPQASARAVAVYPVHQPKNTSPSSSGVSQNNTTEGRRHNNRNNSQINGQHPTHRASEQQGKKTTMISSSSVVSHASFQTSHTSARKFNESSHGTASNHISTLSTSPTTNTNQISSKQQQRSESGPLEEEVVRLSFEVATANSNLDHANLQIHNYKKQVSQLESLVEKLQEERNGLKRRLKDEGKKQMFGRISKTRTRGAACSGPSSSTRTIGGGCIGGQRSHGTTFFRRLSAVGSSPFPKPLKEEDEEESSVDTTGVQENAISQSRLIQTKSFEYEEEEIDFSSESPKNTVILDTRREQEQKIDTSAIRAIDGSQHNTNKNTETENIRSTSVASGTMPKVESSDEDTSIKSETSKHEMDTSSNQENVPSSSPSSSSSSTTEKSNESALISEFDDIQISSSPIRVRVSKSQMVEGTIDNNNNNNNTDKESTVGSTTEEDVVDTNKIKDKKDSDDQSVVKPLNLFGLFNRHQEPVDKTEEDQKYTTLSGNESCDEEDSEDEVLFEDDEDKHQSSLSVAGESETCNNNEIIDPKDEIFEGDPFATAVTTKAIERQESAITLNKPVARWDTILMRSSGILGGLGGFMKLRR